MKPFIVTQWDLATEPSGGVWLDGPDKRHFFPYGTHLYTADQLKASIEDEAQNPWKRAIIDAAVVNWTLTKEHESDPSSAVNALLCIAAQMSLDPSISGDAAELVRASQEKILLEAAEQWVDEPGEDAYGFLRRMADELEKQ